MWNLWSFEASVVHHINTYNNRINDINLRYIWRLPSKRYGFKRNKIKLMSSVGFWNFAGIGDGTGNDEMYQKHFVMFLHCSK